MIFRFDVKYTLCKLTGNDESEGTGKTLLVEKLAAESGLPLLVLAPSSVLSKWAGDSEKTLKRVIVHKIALVVPPQCVIPLVHSVSQSW